MQWAPGRLREAWRLEQQGGGRSRGVTGGRRPGWTLQDRKAGRGAAVKEAEEWPVRLGENRDDDVGGTLVTVSLVTQGEGRAAPRVVGADRGGAGRWTDLSPSGSLGPATTWDDSSPLDLLCTEPAGPRASPGPSRDPSSGLQVCAAESLQSRGWSGLPPSPLDPRRTSMISQLPPLPLPHMQPPCPRTPQGAPDWCLLVTRGRLTSWALDGSLIVRVGSFPV